MKPGKIRRRNGVDAGQPWPADIHPLLARVFAARGLAPADVLVRGLADLATPASLGGVALACDLLIAAIGTGERICIVGDFDADGATGTAVAVRGLRLLGACNVCYRVPNRLRDGYGLTPGVVESLRDVAPDLIVTVDNGIASHAGVAAAQARGMRVIVTDHHLPGVTLPAADAIVNPNCVGDPFPSKSLAGVGVMFYLLVALRARMFPADSPDGDGQNAAAQGQTSKRKRPDLSSLLDLVALGTVADLVALDSNNRILVEAGLKRMRANRSCAGVQALFKVAGRDPLRAVAADLGFALGPRINAAGRLEDMSLGIECLLSDDTGRAEELAARLSAINHERQGLQATMVEQADANIDTFLTLHHEGDLPYGIVVHEPGWHPGVIGLVASRLKERLHRPVIALAPEVQTVSEACAQGSPLPFSDEQDASKRNQWRGSARSIAGFHMRDALAEVDARCPGLISRFGGHAMAAGLTIDGDHLAMFATEFDAVARRHLDDAALENLVWSDGELDPAYFTIDAARILRAAGPWGQAFPEPAFDNVFEVDTWRMVGERHLKARLRLIDGGKLLDAIMFNALEAMPPPARIRAVHQLDINAWNGSERLQLLLRHIESA